MEIKLQIEKGKLIGNLTRIELIYSFNLIQEDTLYYPMILNISF